MKKFFTFATAVVCSVAFVACESKSGSEENNGSDSLAVESVAATEILTPEAARIAEFGETLYGTYTATLPAADASAIESTLVLNADNSYTLEQKFVGKEEVQPENGVVSDANFEAQTITLTSAEGVVSQYKVLEGGSLLLLQADGTEPTDVAAYTYTRQ